MRENTLSEPEKRELEFNKKVVGEYLKYGSVDEVFRRNQYDLPISFAGFHRLLDRWGVVKAAGPNSKLTEAVDFLEQLAYEKIPLERLYKKMPPSFKTSAVTLHRILSHIKRGVIRRAATALIVTIEGDPERLLIARDVSTPRLEYGKPYGSFTLPMGFSKRKESKKDSILRVMQQEVFSFQTVEQNFPYELIDEDPQPMIHFDVIDIRLSLYHIKLPVEYADLEQINSFKLTDFQLSEIDKVFENKDLFRSGVPELCGMYRRNMRLDQGFIGETPVFTSELNVALAEYWNGFDD